jgi:RNA polymerase sigma-70 factor (ECF subfamily)
MHLTQSTFFAPWALLYKQMAYLTSAMGRQKTQQQLSTQQEGTYLQKLLHDNEEQFMEYIFRTYYASLCKTVYNITRDSDAAEDIVQDVFMKVWRRKAQLDFSKSIKSYLFRSSVNTALNYLEKNRRNTSIEETEADPIQLGINTTEDAIGYQEVNHRIQQAMEALPPKCRTVFSLSRFEELSYAEIAEQLDISVKAVEKHMGKALKHMRAYLQSFINYSA